MTYEEYLDEVTTLLTELYDLDDESAIKLEAKNRAWCRPWRPPADLS